MKKRIKRTTHQARIYLPGDPRAERNSRLSDVRSRLAAPVLDEQLAQEVEEVGLTEADVLALIAQDRVMTVAFSSAATVAAAAFLPIEGGVASTATRGIALPWAGTLIEASAWKANTATTCQLDVRGGTTVKYSHTITPAGTESTTETDLNVSFDAGEVVNVLVNGASANLTNGGGILLAFRRRQ